MVHVKVKIIFKCDINQITKYFIKYWTKYNLCWNINIHENNTYLFLKCLKKEFVPKYNLSLYKQWKKYQM